MQWKVKTADMSHLSPTIGAVRTVDMGLNVTDVNDVNATVLDPVTGYQTDCCHQRASTGDLTAQFPGGSCNPTAAGNDADLQVHRRPSSQSDIKCA